LKEEVLLLTRSSEENQPNSHSQNNSIDQKPFHEFLVEKYLQHPELNQQTDWNDKNSIRHSLIENSSCIFSNHSSWNIS
jgi:hypothetical protein